MLVSSPPSPYLQVCPPHYPFPLISNCLLDISYNIQVNYKSGQVHFLLRNFSSEINPSLVIGCRMLQVYKCYFFHFDMLKRRSGNFVNVRDTCRYHPIIRPLTHTTRRVKIPHCMGENLGGKFQYTRIELVFWGVMSFVRKSLMAF